MSNNVLFTIGFTKKSAEEFFTALVQAGVCHLIDVRLNNISQLAGFTKQNDLQYFLKEICGISYIHYPSFAPTEELLKAYRKRSIDWETYEREFKALIRERAIEKNFSRESLDHSCLLCSELDARHCHRRIAAEYLRDQLGGITLCHL
jgi:uncharacterized protein (DUF488 family)